ncbi:hypothetical protein B0H14DRAFT_2642724 [Mycena olivaceomarginata]|nr:hypothetical protein B0H14DRAFT_2642724 [Mycena olivaceomarginata]
MPPLRATSSAAERLLGDPSTSLHASASVLSARSPGLIRGPSSAGLRAASGAAKRLPAGRPVYVPLPATASVLSARSPSESIGGPYCSSGRRYAFLARHVELVASTLHAGFAFRKRGPQGPANPQAATTRARGEFGYFPYHTTILQILCFGYFPCDDHFCKS